MKRNKKWLTLFIVAFLFVFCLSGVTNVDAAAKIKLSNKKVTLTEGKSKKIKLKNAKKSRVKWSSANKKIAKVTSAGKIKAIKAGTTYISAKYKGKIYKCKVVVKAKKNKASNDESTDDGGSEDESDSGDNSNSSGIVYVSATGSKYHSINNCGNMNPSKARSMTESEAVSLGYGKCSKCW